MTVREIVLDTETTGMDPKDGHRIVEIGCVELVGHVPTGRTWHRYLNPERTVDAEAAAVHGLTTDFLKDKPVFAEVIEDFLAFVGDATLVIHNAEFDVKFLNAEMKPFGFGPVDLRAVIDTLKMARAKFPGSPASLDALCKRFGIDNSGRTLHGALLDSQLLAEVYLELIGGRQQGLALSADAPKTTLAAAPAGVRKARPPRHFPLGAGDAAQHGELVARLGEKALWRKWG